MIDPKALDLLIEETKGAIIEDLPILAERMRTGRSGDKKRVGRLTVTVEFVDDPGSETKSAETSCHVESKLTLPKVIESERKVIWDNGQMALL